MSLRFMLFAGAGSIVNEEAIADKIRDLRAVIAPAPRREEEKSKESPTVVLDASSSYITH